MMKPCIICYKLCSNISNPNEIGGSGLQEKLQKFFSLLGRHLHHETTKNVSGKWSPEHRLFQNLTNAGLQTCAECSTLVESFCELYHEMKSIELLLNFKLTTIKNAMRGGQESTYRQAELRSRATQLMNGVTVHDIIQSKSHLVKICEQKLTTSTTYPKVALQRQEAMIEQVLKNTAGSKLVDPSLTSDGTGQEEKPDDVAGSTNNRNCTVIVIRSTREEQSGNDFQQKKRNSSMSGTTQTEDKSFQRNKPRLDKSATVHQSCTNMDREIQPGSNYDTMNQNDVEQNCDWRGSISALLNEVTGSAAKLIAVHRCAKCKKSFSSSAKLESHDCRGPTQEEASNVAKVPGNRSREVKKKTIIGVAQNVPRRPQGRIDQETGKISCSICERKFTTQPGLWAHWKSIHLQEKHTCPICDKTFSHQNGLKYHQNTHKRSQARFSCPTCSKTFTTKQYLGIHQDSIHSGKRNKGSQCQLCNKSFSSPVTLRIHMKSFCPVVRNGDNEHKRKYNLETTINPINGKHTCSLCGKEFAWRHGLVLHHKTSHLQINHTCKLCGKVFTQAHAYRRHHKRFHRGVPFTCSKSECKKSISAPERAGESTGECAP